MKNKTTIALAVALTLTACATGPKTIPVKDMSVLENTSSKIMSIQEDAGAFMPSEPTTAAFGALGAMAMLSKGKTFVKEQNLANPAERMEKQVREYLVQKYNLEISGDNVDYRGEKKPKAFLEKPNALVVDAGTVSWGYNYFPVSWGRYNVFYNAVIQLVDGNTGTLIAGHACTMVSHKKSDGAPSLKELKANESALIKSTLNDLADKCVAEFKSEALSAG